MSVDAYVICTSPRSGSTLLCRLLRQTGVAGYPGSHFHEASLDAWLKYYDIPKQETTSELDAIGKVFDAAIARGARQTGMFGLRLQRHSFDFFFDQLARLHPGCMSGAQRMATAFGETAYIHLRRSDKLAQAISYVKAEQSGLWHRSADGRELERLAPPRDPSYDRAEIQRQLDRFSAYDEEWEDWFEREQIAPLQISYEDLADAPYEGVKRMLDHLGLDRAVAARLEVDVAKLADRTNLDWEARFRRGD